MRNTKIICTIGPASQSEDKLRELMLAGMNVGRFNFSHGDHEEQLGKLERMRKVSKELNLPIAALLDTKGPEIRLRDFEEGKTELVAGQKFTLTTREMLGTNEIVSISYKELVKDVKAGTTILIDDGLIEMTVEEVTDTDIICRVENGGPVSNRKGRESRTWMRLSKYLTALWLPEEIWVWKYRWKKYRFCRNGLLRRQLRQENRSLRLRRC